MSATEPNRWLSLQAAFGAFLTLAFTSFSLSLAFGQASFEQKESKVEIVVEANGEFTQTSHVEIRALNDTGARSVSQQALAYSDSLQELDVPEAHTLKADGKKLAVDPSAIFSQLPSGAPQVPMFTDQRQKTVVYPDVSGGDSVVATIKIHQKQAQIPGQFTLIAFYPRTISYNQIDETISAPNSMPLYVEAHQITVDKHIHGDRTIYHWAYKAPKALVEEPLGVSVFDEEPRVYVSSFRSYDDLAHAYFLLSQPKVAVTPKVQEIADQATAGISDRRQQTQKIYEWVSRHIRYVAIYFGNGGLVPHDPDTVISNGYGDCKDHTVLFEALLKAKGIDSQTVLVNLDNSYTLPYSAPGIGQLNHAITWIPEFSLYADTTAVVAPFGTLPLREYGKPAVHIVAAGDSSGHIPALPAGSFSTDITTATKLLPDGTVTGTTTISAKGPASIALRLAAMGIQSIGIDRAVKGLFGSGGKGGLDFAPPEILTPDYSIKAHFSMEANPKLISGDRFYIFPGLRILEKAGEGLMGPLDTTMLKKIDRFPCYSGHQTEYFSLELPPGQHIASPPSDTHIKNAHMEFNSHWDHDLHSISVHRDFTSKVDQPLCSDETLMAAIPALDQISDDYNSSIWLTDTLSEGTQKATPPDMQEFDSIAKRILDNSQKTKTESQDKSQ